MFFFGFRGHENAFFLDRMSLKCYFWCKGVSKMHFFVSSLNFLGILGQIGGLKMHFFGIRGGVNNVWYSGKN